MDNLEKINNIPFLDVLSKLGLQTQKEAATNEYRIQVPGESRISNGSYKLNYNKNVVFANGSTRPQWTVFQFMGMYLNTKNDRAVFAWFEENFQIKTAFEKAKPNVSKKTFLTEFHDKYMIQKIWSPQIMGAIKTWLTHRGFSHDYLSSPEADERIMEVFKYIGFCENPSTMKRKWTEDWLPSRPVLMFPSLDVDGKIIGMKLRKVNNMPEDETTKDSKSINVTGSESWVIYWSLAFIKAAKQVIIVEWEPDYIVMRMLGYDNVIGNLGGVNSCREIIRDLIKFTWSVIIAYDNDGPGRKGAQKLAEFCKRQMFYIKYIDRKNVKGEVYKDINEFYEAGFNRDDFENMLKGSTEIKFDDDGRGDYDNKDSKVLLTMSNENPFIYLRKNYEFYDIYENRIAKKESVTDWMGIDGKDLKEMLMTGEIKKFYDICYLAWGRKDHYNVLDEKIIMLPSKTPKIHPDIEFLINNLCWNNQANTDWIHQAILYKYTHINDVLVPAVLFKGVGGSGKGTFIKLLAKIFANENVMQGLWTQSLTSDFCPYTGHKIIVEINELWGGNHKDAVKILDKLKSMIFEPRIMVNMKGIQPREVDNIAWFILSSNHAKPLQLDAGTSGNRRFTIINTGPGIPIETGRRINEAVSDPEVIQDYLAWLYEAYPEVPGWTSIRSLENEDKQLLTSQSESYVDKFVEWMDQYHPQINKITTLERNRMLYQYRIDMGEDEKVFDRKYDITYFNNSLPHHVVQKKVYIRGKVRHGYQFLKEVKGDGFFDTDRYEQDNLFISWNL